MGDGRYYTYRQFFQILYLTILAGGLVYTIVYIQIKSREKERIRYIVISSCFLLFTILLSFIKEVTYELYPAEVISYLSLYGIIGATLTQIVYYNQKSKATIIIGLIALVVTRFHFIDDFTFITTTYSLEFQLLIAGFVILLLIYIVQDIHKSRIAMNKAQKVNGIERYVWLESLTIGGGILITTTSYCFHILSGITAPIHELCLLACVIGFNITFQYFMPHERIPAGYHNLIENMMDTIIIVNEKNHILFINDTELKPMIKEDDVVDFNRLGRLFRIENATTIHLSPTVEQINGSYDGLVVSCKVSYNSIINNKEHLGYVIVIEDCSSLEVMIDELKAKKKDLTKLEIELSGYNQTPQVLRAEKERHRLLIEVQNELGHHLAELTKYIGSTIDYASHESFDEEEQCEILVDSIVQGITMARKNLSQIRDTVKTYRSSYNGKERNDDQSIVSR